MLIFYAAAVNNEFRDEILFHILRRQNIPYDWPGTHEGSEMDSIKIISRPTRGKRDRIKLYMSSPVYYSRRNNKSAFCDSRYSRPLSTSCLCASSLVSLHWARFVTSAASLSNTISGGSGQEM